MNVHWQFSRLRDICRHVLLVEDSIIIAIDAEALVTGLGAERVSIASGVDEALSCVAEDQPTLAILDVKLHDVTSFPIADKLSEMQIPYIFATGYSDQKTFPERHRFAPYLKKPFDQDALRRAIESIPGVEHPVAVAAQY